MSPLEVLVGLPVVVATVIGLVPPVRLVAVPAGLVTATVVLVLAAVGMVLGDSSRPAWSVDRSWVPPLDVHWSVGVDSVSAPLVLLTALLTWCCFVALLRHRPAGPPVASLVVLLLLIEAGSVGTFLARDLIVFFIFFELVLIPMWFVIAWWGTAADETGRRRAASRFLVVTVAGSALVLVGFLLLYARLGTFSLAAIAARRHELPVGVQTAVAVLFLVGFGAKVPVWPLHFWLPDAHSKAPTVGSVLLAGVLLKLGTYGLLRFFYDAVPDGAVRVAPAVGVLGVVGIVYGALACLGQRDLKRLVAYSSIGHMGFVLLAISTMTGAGLVAANFANVAHGLITGLLFFVVGAVAVQAGSTDFERIGGSLYARAPHAAAVFAFAAVASLGLPGLAGFWGEMLAMRAAFSPDPDLPLTTFRVLMVVAGIGVVLTTAYFVRAVRLLCQGADSSSRLPDVSPDEWVSWSPLLACTLALGLAPGLLLWTANATAAGAAVVGR